MERLYRLFCRRTVDASDELDHRFHLRRLVLPDRRPDSPDPRSRWQRAQSHLRANAGWPGARPDAGAEAQGAVRGLGARWQRFLPDIERARCEVLRRLSLRREDLRSHAVLREQGRIFPFGDFRRWALGGAGEAEHDERQRHVPVECRDEGHRSPLAAQRQRQRQPGELRSRVDVSLLRHRRGRGVRPAPPLRSRGSPARGRAEGGLGCGLRGVLAYGPLSRDRDQ